MSCLFVRLHVHHLQGTKGAGGILFADLRQAFYSVVRQFVVPVADTGVVDDMLAKVPQVLAPAIERILAQGTQLEQVCHDEHLVQQVAASQTCTWFVTPNSSQVAKSRCGTQPGRQLAD
eukprot:10904568-Karenia_brevis.AAC.1